MSVTVMVPVVDAVPRLLSGVNVKVPTPPTVKVPLPDVLVNLKSTAITASVSLTVQVGAIKLRVAPVQLVPLLAVPTGVAMLAVLVTLPLVAVTVVVTRIW
jgi:hypothetical protein